MKNDKKSKLGERIFHRVTFQSLKELASINHVEQNVVGVELKLVKI